MNITEVRNVIRQVIAEAKAEGGLPKSGGKLVHLKKELDGLKKMKESLGSYTINEGGDGSFVAEYAHMQKFVNELEKIKGLHAKLAEMLDSQISEVEGKVSSETQKVKEIMGLIEKAKAPKEKKEKKADASTFKSKHEKGETKAEEKKEEVNELFGLGKSKNQFKPEQKVIYTASNGTTNYNGEYIVGKVYSNGEIGLYKADSPMKKIEINAKPENLKAA
jgi:flagellar biosynthesis chaperone FliJ